MDKRSIAAGGISNKGTQTRWKRRPGNEIRKPASELAHARLTCANPKCKRVFSCCDITVSMFRSSPYCSTTCAVEMRQLEKLAKGVRC